MVEKDEVEHLLIERKTMKTTNILTSWSPMGDMDKIGRSLLGFLGNTREAGGWGETIGSYDWSPEVDVVEDEKEYRLTADLPDVRREDLHVSLHDGSIELYGERAQRDQGEDLIRHRTERAHGTFRRMFRLPENAAGDKTRAEFRDGALLVHVPKAETATIPGREIPVGS
jgi:HSP20 family protein